MKFITELMVAAHNLLQLTLGFNDGNIARLERVIGLGGRCHLGSVLGNGLTVSKSLGAGAAWVDELIIPTLVGGVLMEDLTPVASHASKATRHNLIKNADLSGLGKVLHPVGTTVASDSIGVLGVFVLPIPSAAER